MEKPVFQEGFLPPKPPDVPLLKPVSSFSENSAADSKPLEKKSLLKPASFHIPSFFENSTADSKLLGKRTLLEPASFHASTFFESSAADLVPFPKKTRQLKDNSTKSPVSQGAFVIPVITHHSTDSNLRETQPSEPRSFIDSIPVHSDNSRQTYECACPSSSSWCYCTTPHSLLQQQPRQESSQTTSENALSEMFKPQLITQIKLNYIVRVMNLSIEDSELLALWLAENNLLDPETRITFFRKRSLSLKDYFSI